MNKEPIALVVDDDPGIRALLKMLLEGSGIKADMAEDGERGMEAVRNRSYDVIISDNEMPRKTGREFFKDVCKYDPDLSKRFIFLSASMERGKEPQSCTILEKPCPPSEFISAVKGVLDFAGAE